MLTVAECKADRGLRTASGVHVASPDFLDLLNAACRWLDRRGGFWGTVQPVAVTVASNRLIWPRYVQTVLATRWHRNSVIPVNRWWSFLPFDPSLHEMVETYRHSHTYTGLVLEQDQNFPVFNPIAAGSSARIQLTPALVNDAGKTLTLFGADANNQTILTARPDGSQQAGEVVTLAYPSALSVNTFSRIDRVFKPVTNGAVTATQVFADASIAPLGFYEPSEISPDYTAHKVHGHTVTAQTITALIKLKFIPVAYDQDLVLIDNLEALKFAIQAMKLNDAEQLQAQQSFEAASIRELNLQLAQNMPEEQEPVSNNTFRGTRIGQQHCF